MRTWWHCCIVHSMAHQLWSGNLCGCHHSKHIHRGHAVEKKKWRIIQQHEKLRWNHILTDDIVLRTERVDHSLVPVTPEALDDDLHDNQRPPWAQRTPSHSGKRQTNTHTHCSQTWFWEGEITTSVLGHERDSTCATCAHLKRGLGFQQGLRACRLRCGPVFIQDVIRF